MATGKSSSYGRVFDRSAALSFWISLLVSLLIPSHGFLTQSSRRLSTPASKYWIAHVGEQRKLLPPVGAIHASKIDEFPINIEEVTKLTHSDIEWRLRPPKGTTLINRLKLKMGANILRLDTKIKGGKLPPVLCPRGGQAVLEAYYKGVL